MAYIGPFVNHKLSVPTRQQQDALWCLRTGWIVRHHNYNCDMQKACKNVIQLADSENPPWKGPSALLLQQATTTMQEVLQTTLVMLRR